MLPIYYPGEPRFAPDLLAVLDVEDVDRDKWSSARRARGPRLSRRHGARGASARSTATSIGPAVRVDDLLLVGGRRRSDQSAAIRGWGRKVTLAPIPSLWGHPAGAGASPEDLAFIEQKLRAFLGTP